MGIEKFVKSVCVQPAVYWGNPVADGFGGFTFDDPVEIKCRWEDKALVVMDATGIERMTDAQIMVTQDLDVLGFLYLGTMDEVESMFESGEQDFDPMKVDGARQILAFEKVPMIKSTKVFVRQVYVKRLMR